MEWLLLSLPAVACAAMMLLICLPMLFGRKSDHSGERSVSHRELAELRDEVTRLKTERDLENRTGALDG